MVVLFRRAVTKQNSPLLKWLVKRTKEKIDKKKEQRAGRKKKRPLRETKPLRAVVNDRKKLARGLFLLERANHRAEVSVVAAK